MTPWPRDIPRPPNTVLEDMACAMTIKRAVVPHHSARSFVEEVYPDLYRIVRAQVEREAVERKRELETL